VINPYHKNKNASPLYCPRCNSSAVDRDNRICKSCKGRLVFPNDNCLIDYLDNRGDDWYMFYIGLYNRPAWHHSSFFRKRPIPMGGR
jgi:predicted amidophosphoribosyltransferase